MQMMLSRQRPQIGAHAAQGATHCAARATLVMRSRQQERPQPRATAGSPVGATIPTVLQEGADPAIIAFQEIQRTAPRPSPAEQARTLMASGRAAVLSTTAAKGAGAGAPTGSVVEFAVDAQGRPLLVTSSLSAHTADLEADGRCSLTVMAPDFQSLGDPRVSVAGALSRLPDADREAARAAYLAKYPDAFYVDFGDFRWWRMDSLLFARLNSGFGPPVVVPAAEYAAAQPDPVAPVSARVCSHMNDDHEEDIKAMVAYYLGLPSVAAASMARIDRLGSALKLVVAQGEAPIAARLPFIRPVEAPKEVKEVLVEMTRTARKAAAAAAEQPAAKPPTGQ